MPRIIAADGPVAAALKRYDPDLRVRWSWERKAWAVEAKVKHRYGIVPPVFFLRDDASGLWNERLLPEHSDRYICYRDSTYIILWAKVLDARVLQAVVDRDSNRVGGEDGLVDHFDADVRRVQWERDASEHTLVSERSREAYDRLRFLNKTRPWDDQIGAAA